LPGVTELITVLITFVGRWSKYKIKNDHRNDEEPNSTSCIGNVEKRLIHIYLNQDNLVRFYLYSDNVQIERKDKKRRIKFIHR